MANVQAQLENFLARIRLDREENSTLRKKREAVWNRLCKRLPLVFAEHGEGCPGFELRDQGSYKMGTAIYPMDGDFDIDLGLYFAIDRDKWHPVELKMRVFEALEGHTPGIERVAGVRIRRPCVTVQYHRRGEPVYHVDIAVYAGNPDQPSETPFLAVGKARSKAELCEWAPSDAGELSRAILGKYSGDKLRQFRSVVRYLKRWRDLRFPRNGNAAPLGIALTVAASEHFEWKQFRDGTPNDLAALRCVAEGLREQFSFRLGRAIWFGDAHYKIRIDLPVEPYSDLCERMTRNQMTGFYHEVDRLDDVLRAAHRTESVANACTLLQEVFGEEFPGG